MKCFDEENTLVQKKKKEKCSPAQLHMDGIKKVVVSNLTAFVMLISGSIQDSSGGS
jgi:hypothetical protein